MGPIPHVLYEFIFSGWGAVFDIGKKGDHQEK